MTNAAQAGVLLDGAQLRDLFATAARHLGEMAPHVDAINVYPVPDGDTGANMAATLRQAIESAAQLGDAPGLRAVVDALARGALYGARGNSGVILSQALRGFAKGVSDAEMFDAATLAAGLNEAANAAYAAVSQPSEGTMLTVLRIAAQAANMALAVSDNGGAGVPCTSVLTQVVAAAEEAEAGTMEQLLVLKEAGVPDAGGEGVCVILRGLLGAMTGVLPSVPAVVHTPVAASFEHRRDAFGFCTEFVIDAATMPLEIARLREIAEAGGNTSVVVVGTEETVRVHVHTEHPDAVLDAVRKLGAISRVKVENMDAQHVRFRETGSGAGAHVAMLALSRGEGFDSVFRGLGAAVSDLGDLEKPPAGELAAAADALQVPDVILLPNHKNVLLAARQAATLTRCTLHVVPSESLPQGIASALAFDADAEALTNVREMGDAIGRVQTVEVTTAIAPRSADGVVVLGGQTIALLDGRLIAAGDTAEQVLMATLHAAQAEEATLITIYGGAALAAGELERLRAAVANEFDVEAEAITGGQGLYQLIASVEA